LGDRDTTKIDIVEALCVVGIQAYAELNNWHQVLPFVQKVYSSIEDCPFRVIQLWYVQREINKKKIHSMMRIIKCRCLMPLSTIFQ
jgi:hypothetical protein